MSNKFLYILPILLAACSSAASTPTEPSPANTIPEITLATSATSTSMKPSSTPMAEIVERPLAPKGPWIFAYNEYSYDRPYFLNLDGTGYFALDTPPAPIMLNWCWDASNASPSNGYTAHCLQDADQLELQITNLSDGSIIRTIPLFGEQARQLIEDYIPPTEVAFNPPFPPVTFSVGSYLWSPNGEYLAFVGAIDGTSGDIYVYEPEQDSIRRLTSGPGEAEIMGWSPDSRSIVHISGNAYDTFNSLIGEEVWIVDIDGKITSLYSLPVDRSFAPIIIDWIDEYTFISLRHTFESNPINLSLVNIASLEFTLIDAPRFLYVLFDSSHNRLLINWGPAMGPGGHGVYEYSLNTGQLSDFTDDMEIKEILPLVPYYYGRNRSFRLLIDENGEIVSELNCQQSESHVSPDGRFILKPDGASITLTDFDMNTIRNLDDVLLAHWLPDSSGFYAYVGDYDLYETNTYQVYLYSENKDWQPVLINVLSIYGCFTFVKP